MKEPNPFIGVNYLDIDHKMAIPPPYWLQRLHDFDNMLVVFPSIKTPFAYVLARRRQRSVGMSVKALHDVIDQPDTKFCLRNGLVPVSMIYRYSDGWSIDNIIRALKARDVWAAGGAEKAADLMDESDAQEETQRKQALHDDLYARSGQAWESYKRRTGQRVSSSGRATVPPTPTTSTSGRAVSPGLIALA